LPSVWQGNPSQEPYYPNPGQPPPPAPETYYPQNQQWQSPVQGQAYPQQWQPPQAPGQVYNQQWQPPQQQWQNPNAPMAPAYAAGYGQPPAYTMPPPGQTQWMSPKPELTGIGGWLVLPAIGIIIRPLIALFGVFACLAFFGGAQNIIAAIGLNAYQQLKPIVGFELLGNLFMIGFCAYVAVMFFGKKKSAPKLYTAMLFAQVIFVTIDALLMNFLYPATGQASGPNSEASSLASAFIAAGIWASYFNKSVRVKNTFVN
jgi:hypothetical protein